MLDPIDTVKIGGGGSIAGWLTAGAAWTGLLTFFGIVVRQVLPFWKERNRREEAGRDDLFELIDRQAKRITELETEVRDERRRCDDELGKMRAQIEGLHRQIVTISLQRAVSLGDAPTAAARFLGTGDALRSANPLPDDELPEA